MTFGFIEDILVTKWIFIVYNKKNPLNYLSIILYRNFVACWETWGRS